MINLTSGKPPGYLAFVGLSLGIAALAVLLYAADSGSYRRFFGSLNPLVMTGAAILAGLGWITGLTSHGWFAIFQPGALAGLAWTTGLAVLPDRD